MTAPNDPEVARAVQEGAPRIERLHAALLDDYPALQGSMAVPGMLVGHGLAVFVANGMTNDQIVANVLAIVAEVRQAHAKIQDAAAIAS